MNGFIFHTPTQIVILVLVLVAGWLFGLASHPGGRRWKQRYRDLELKTRRYHEERDAELAARDREIAELRAQRDAAMEGTVQTRRPVTDPVIVDPTIREER
ncbi:hypothetical protein KY084_11550 [Stakelama sp. CBK3Z-3]|uniref:LapA family protein n=1 Tax=Stakelama flava TaxID=2860338 RepID=A0ABS6XMT3_9SPHN|nr:hypothetical protein [Stakelama flava]MBW4331502.1 hypothetical protein [Stakelama flava]